MNLAMNGNTADSPHESGFFYILERIKAVFLEENIPEIVELMLINAKKRSQYI